MNYLSPDHLIVYAFLLITLVIGLWAGRGVKDIREYAIANKMYGTGVLVLTFLATNIGGGSVMSSSREVFTNGIIMTVTELGVVFSLLFIAFFIAPNIVRFEDCITIGDVMGKLYGEASKVITGSLGVLYSICMTSMQLLALAIISESLLGFKAEHSLIIGGLVLATYAAIGGIKSVTITDVFQFLILISVIPLIASLALNKTWGVQELLQQIPREKFNVFSHENFSYYLTLFLVWSIFPVGITSPPLFQRLLMGQNAKQLRDQYLIVAAFDPTFRLVIMLIGLAAVVLYPTIEAKNVIPHIVNELFPTGLRGWAVAGLLAVVISTADSYLHSAGLLLAHDVIKPLGDKTGIAIHELRWARCSTVILGCIAIVIALQAKDLLRLSFTALSFTGPLLMVPLVAGIMRLKPDPWSFYVAMLVTLVTSIVAMLLLPVSHRHLAVPISILANGASFFVMHLIRNRGIAVVHYSVKIEPTRKPLEKLELSPNKLIRYSQQKVAQYGAPYALFGCFCCISYTLPYFMWTYHPPQEYGLMITLRAIGAVACGLLMAHEKWSDKWRLYLPSFWHLTILYCLPFVSTVMFLLTQGSIEWVVNITMVIIFLVLLVDWVTFVGLAVLGVVLGLLFYRYFTGGVHVSLDFDAKYLLVYQAIFSTLIGLVFARRKQLRFDKLATDNQALLVTDLAYREQLLEAFREKVRIIQTLKHAGIQNLLHVAKLIKDLRVQDQNSPLSEVTPHLEATLIPMALQLQGIEHRATDYLRLQTESFSINELLERVQSKLLTQGMHQEMRYRLPTQREVLECDPARLISLFANGIAALQPSVDKQVPVLVGIEDTQLHYSLPSVQAGYIKKIPALRITITTRPRLPALQAAYIAQMNVSSLSTPEHLQALVLLANQRIVKAHYGYSNVSEDTQCYVLPVWLREVRPEDMDKPYMELGVAPVRANDYYPGAQAQEKAFLTAVVQRTTANIETVKTVLEMIKWYHGPVYRNTGEPFYLHPLAVAHIVLDYNQEEATILGALLHDTVEDTHMLLEHIETIFGEETAEIVNNVTHLEGTKDTFYKIKLSAEENILMLLESEDDRVMCVKLADRMHNMRTIEGKTTTSQARIAKETLQFFVPQAQRLGLHQVAQELKERSSKVLQRMVDET